jgi:hypothetical protein
LIAHYAVLDRLPVAVHRLELLRQLARPRDVVRQQQLEGGARMSQTACGVDPRREPETDCALVDARRIDPRDLHQRAQPGFLRARERTQSRERERAVFVDERNNVGDRRQADQIQMPFEIDAERLRQLVDDPRAAELGERILGRPRCDDRAVGKHLSRTVVVGDDDVETERPRARDLVQCRDPAVDRQDEAAALLGQPRDRLAADAVALVEA